jgi:phosphoglucomutase
MTISPLAGKPDWPARAAIGQTLVSSSLIDRVAAAHGRRILEVPVGFKWFVAGLLDGSCCLGGEESAGEPITAKLTVAPGNGAPIGGLKVTARSGWFAARPSGTENIHKIYAESFIGRTHLDGIVREAREIERGVMRRPLS